MSHAIHDTIVLLGIAAIDLSIVAAWQFLCSRFVSGRAVVAPPPDADAASHAARSKLHRVLGSMSLILLIGLITEATVSAPWYVLRYGFTR